MRGKKQPTAVWHLALLALLGMIIGILLAATIVRPHPVHELKSASPLPVLFRGAGI